MLNIDLKQYLKQDRYTEIEFWERDNEMTHFFDIYNKLVEYVNTEIKSYRFQFYGKLDIQLYEAILAEQTLYMVSEKHTVSVIETLEENIVTYDYEDVMKILARYIDDFQNLYEHQFKGECRFSNEKNSINDRAALSICMMILKSIIYNLESRLYPLLEEFKSENKKQLTKIKKELDDN
jgi:hypothetical protein